MRLRIKGHFEQQLRGTPALLYSRVDARPHGRDRPRYTFGRQLNEAYSAGSASRSAASFSRQSPRW